MKTCCRNYIKKALKDMWTSLEDTPGQ
jgi:hypothetical protein